MDNVGASFYRPDDIPVYIYDMLATNINAIASVCA